MSQKLSLQIQKLFDAPALVPRVCVTVSALWWRFFPTPRHSVWFSSMCPYATKPVSRPVPLAAGLRSSSMLLLPPGKSRLQPWRWHHSDSCNPPLLQGPRFPAGAPSGLRFQALRVPPSPAAARARSRCCSSRRKNSQAALMAAPSLELVPSQPPAAQPHGQPDGRAGHGPRGAQSGSDAELGASAARRATGKPAPASR